VRVNETGRVKHRENDSKDALERDYARRCQFITFNLLIIDDDHSATVLYVRHET